MDKGAACYKGGMPYRTNDDLPPSVHHHLPPQAQDIYRAAFNHAWQEYGDEATPHRVAWAAVKRRYHKIGDAWVPRDAQGSAGIDGISHA